MITNNAIKKALAIVTLSLQVIACSEADFSNKANDKAGAQERLTLKALLTLDKDDQLTAVSGFGTACVLPLSFPINDGDLGGYWIGGTDCISICRVVSSPASDDIGGEGSVDGPVEIQALVSLEKLADYVTDQDDDTYDDLLGDCGSGDGGVIIDPTDVIPVEGN